MDCFGPELRKALMQRWAAGAKTSAWGPATIERNARRGQERSRSRMVAARVFRNSSRWISGSLSGQGSDAFIAMMDGACVYWRHRSKTNDGAAEASACPSGCVGTGHIHKCPAEGEPFASGHLIALKSGFDEVSRYCVTGMI